MFNGFKVFISFKNTDGRTFDGREIYTPDRAFAEEIYNALTAAGIKTFYSNAVIRGSGSVSWTDQINDALMEASVMIVVGTKIEYICGEQVKYEWQYFRQQMLAGRPKQLFTAMQGIDFADLPPAFTGIENISPRDISSVVEMTKALLSRLEPNVSYASAPAAPSPASYDDSVLSVTLTDPGNNKLRVIGVIRSVTGLGLKEAKDIVDNVPSVVMRGVFRGEANSIVAELREAGAAAEISGGCYSVSLMASGANKLSVIKVVRSVTGFGLKDSKDMVENTPAVVMRKLLRSEAETLVSELREAGAVAEITRHI